MNVLLEIGVEELPVAFVHSGMESLWSHARALFEQQRLTPQGLQVFGTPRRLALLATGVPDAQPDREEVVTGPPWAVAFKDGQPSKAAIGFAKKNGVDVDKLRKLETEKGEYVAADVFEKGSPAAKVLPEVLSGLCAKVHFPKSMRWGQGDFAFGRPIHWIVALAHNEIVEFELCGVRAGRVSRGHRFLSPAEVTIPDADAYLSTLLAAEVVVDGDKRRELIRDALGTKAAELGADIIGAEELIDECAYLVEKPHLVIGSIDEPFLALPEDVVVSVMRDHQRYFALRNDKGLIASYLNIANTANNPELIAKGNDRVLRARLADAQFFVEEDRKRTLDSRVDGLDAITFQKALGSIGDKRRRIEKLAMRIAADSGADVQKAEQAARLCKTDLETHIVFEFPELQGAMGRYYALQEGLDKEVADAIAEHYRPAGAQDAVAASPLGAVVGVADRLDTLAGCFGIGQKPSSSADPFGLRRAALGVIRSALEGPIDIELAPRLREAVDAYATAHEWAKDHMPIEAALREFFDARLRAHYRESYPGDLVDATLAAWNGGSLRDLDARMKAVDAFRKAEAFEELATAFKRAFNISKDGPEGSVDEALFTEDAERDLFKAVRTSGPVIGDHIAHARYFQALETIGADLRAPIDQFFDKVLVIHDDESIRHNRLRLLREITGQVTGIVHFHRLSL